MLEPEGPNPRMVALEEAVQQWLAAVLGKPKRKTNTKKEWEWGHGPTSGSLTIWSSHSDDSEPPVRTFELLWAGAAPTSTSRLTQGPDPAQPVPVADELRLSLNTCMGDTFDAVVVAEAVEVTGRSFPCEVSIRCTVNDGMGPVRDLKVCFDVEDASIDVPLMAIECIGEALDEG